MEKSRFWKNRNLMEKNSFEMELIIKQVTTVVIELEDNEFQNIADVLGEDRSNKADCIVSNICLVKTARDINSFPSEQLVFYEKLQKKREKQIINVAMHNGFIHMDFYKKYFPRMKRLRDERNSQASP